MGIYAMWRAEPTRDGAHRPSRFGKLVIIAFGEAGFLVIRTAFGKPGTDQVAADCGRWGARDDRRTFTIGFDDTGTPRSVARPFEIGEAAGFTISGHLCARSDGRTMPWTRR